MKRALGWFALGAITATTFLMATGVLVLAGVR